MTTARDVVRRVLDRAEASDVDCTGYISWLKNDETGGLEKVASDLLESCDPEMAVNLLYLLSMEAFIHHVTKDADWFLPLDNGVEGGDGA